MPDIRFEPSTDGDKVTLSIYGVDQSAVDEGNLPELFQQTEFRRYYLNPQSLEKACKIFRTLQQDQRQRDQQSEAAPATQPASALVVSPIVDDTRNAPC